MKRWWKRLAVVAAWLGVGVTVHAQGFTAGPHGAARMPEPLRYSPGPAPDLVPGPLTPQIAPVGPPPELSLPASHSNAYPLEKYSTEAGWYASIGGQFLKRYRSEHGPSVFLDPVNNLDTGILSSQNLPIRRNTADVDPAYRPGGRLTLGYLLGSNSIEVNGFYTPEESNEKALTNPGQLSLQFAGPNGSFPIGFDGNNGIFTQADRVVLTFRNEIGGGEVLYRQWNAGVNGFDLLVGARHLYVNERLGIFVDDEAGIVDDFGRSDPLRQAEYASQIRTNFVGLTVGGEGSWPLWQNGIWLTAIGKAAAGVNVIERRLSLTRGDGFQAFDVKSHQTQFGHLYDATIALDIHLL
ncbi:MAG: hypothetical protein ACRC7O_16675, partial [Fimbriiglobus sp.]